ncbi:MAG TPA: hypothetical protein VKQ89_05940 [Candidatus Angelobacter sp.]|nr:hypothetical protein [Candidatus Angelobacter sp.]
MQRGPRIIVAIGSFTIGTLTNSEIAELLAVAAESAKMPLQKALRRASRKAFLWPEEAAQVVEQGPTQLRFIELGLASALVGGVKRDRILNFMTADELLRWIAAVREQAATRSPAA